MSKTFVMWRDRGLPWVKVVEGDNEHQRLLPNYRRLSAVGFEWGYAGNGPTDLAYSILHEFVGTEPMATQTAVEFANAFMERVVSKKQGDWKLPEEEIREFLFVMKRERPVAAVVEFEEAMACGG